MSTCTLPRSASALRVVGNFQHFATIKAYRRKGGAVVTVQREGRAPHRYRVTLTRYHALREWTIRQHHWKTSGAYMQSSMTTCLWIRDANPPTNGGDRTPAA